MLLERVSAARGLRCTVLLSEKPTTHRLHPVSIDGPLNIRNVCRMFDLYMGSGGRCVGEHHKLLTYAFSLQRVEEINAYACYVGSRKRRC